MDTCLSVDSNAAMMIGSTTAQVGTEIRSALVGSPLGTYALDDGSQLDARLRVSDVGVEGVDGLRRMPVSGMAGSAPLGTVADVDVVEVRGTVTRVDGAPAATVSAEITRELYSAAKDKGISFVDAPISGGQAGAENGVLSVMCGGDQPAFDSAEPVIDAYARICRRIGESGAGQLTKMCNQIAIAGLVQGLSEALHFAEKAGLNGRDVVEVISQGAAGSWQMSNRYETMLDDEFNHGFAVDWMRKDLGICLDTANETGASLPVTALVDQFYKEVQKIGGGRWDTSSLIKRLRALDS